MTVFAADAGGSTAVEATTDGLRPVFAWSAGALSLRTPWSRLPTQDAATANSPEWVPTASASEMFAVHPWWS